MDPMDNIKLTLENDSDFYRAYINIHVRDTQRGEAGASADVQRRNCITAFARKLDLPYATMRQRIELQRYFDERYNLCPYGLRSQAEMEAAQTNKLCELSPTQAQHLTNYLENDEMTTQNNAPTIETKTFIGGVDATTMTDEQIFKKIREIESEVADLKKTEHKPKKLEAKIAAMEKAILDLVAYVDERDAK